MINRACLLLVTLFLFSSLSGCAESEAVKAERAAKAASIEQAKQDGGALALKCTTAGGVWEPESMHSMIPHDPWNHHCLMSISEHECNASMGTWNPFRKQCTMLETEQERGTQCVADGGNWLELSAGQHTCQEEYGSEKCAHDGGTFYPSSQACVYHSKDGGKACTDSSQCEFVCLAEFDPKTNTEKGQCAASRPLLGCNNYMENGEAVGICVD